MDLLNSVLQAFKILRHNYVQVWNQLIKTSNWIYQQFTEFLRGAGGKTPRHRVVVNKKIPVDQTEW